MLSDLARGMGQTEMVNEFSVALREEEEHLAAVRRWTKTAMTSDAGVPETAAI
jgi:hypothetical protein